MEGLNNPNRTTDMLKAVAIAIALFVAAGGVRLSSAQQQVSFNADKQIVRAGFNVEVLVEGLAACSGELVEVGWFDNNGDESIVAPVPIDASGRGQISLAPSTPGALSAGVRDSCVAGGVLISDVVLFVVDLENPPGSEGAAFRWGEGLDLYASVPVGETVTLFAEGLSACAGQGIELGFYAGGIADLAAATQVDESGNASVTLVPTAPSSDQRPGALGDCLASGFVLGSRSFASTVPPPNGDHGATPIAPVVGQGSRGAEGSPSWPIFLGGGLFALIASGLAIAWVTRRQ